ncbi:MAG: DUF839 domain-containing protein [Myxococcales bacterium]|nr:DUF839 domain-containing protein [Myxococcales bacterium]
MPRLSRRALVALGLTVPLSMVFSRRAGAALGPLVPDPKRILDLPRGFSYRVLETVGADMTDGYRVPGSPDGMACFDPGDGTLVLMRNHELAAGDRASPYKEGQSPPPEAVDPRSPGGVTRLVLDRQTLARRSSNLVLVGSARNCAGGTSPWGWLSCEETLEEGHGYVYLCDPKASSVRAGRKIASYGRFNHESASVDPKTLIAYLTEDRPTSCFYRFVPSKADEPFTGKLQALVVSGERTLDTGSALRVGVPVEIEWIDVADPDPGADTVGEAARAAGAAIFRRGEGLWIHDGLVYFSATAGGRAESGQIFRLAPNGDRGTLELVAEGGGEADLDYPDNISVSPGGGLVVAEDGGGKNYLRGLDAEGKAFDFARCVYPSELTGVCFAPSGRAIFVNLQQAGFTIVIEGPLDEIFGAPPAPSPQPVTPASAPGHAAADRRDLPPEAAAPAAPDGCGCDAAPPHDTGIAGVAGLAAITAAALRKRSKGEG